MQTFVYQQWPKSIFPFVNFIFSHCKMWVWGGGGSSYGCQPFSYILAPAPLQRFDEVPNQLDPHAPRLLGKP